MTNYSKGADFERKCLKALHELGWGACRSAGSHGLVDVVAWFGHTVLMVQCKINGRLDPGEWNELFNEAKETGAVPILAMRASGKIVWRRLLTEKIPGCRLKNYSEIDNMNSREIARKGAWEFISELAAIGEQSNHGIKE